MLHALSLLGALELHLESKGIRKLPAFRSHTVATLRTVLHEAELGKGLASPVNQALASTNGVLGAAAVVLLSAEALRQAAVPLARAEVQGAKNGGTADVVPVRVLRGTLASMGCLHELGALRHQELALVLEVASGSLDPPPGVDITEGSTSALSDVASSDHLKTE